ncbi:Uu.00g047890.m01.CDS01 [Anthostomella pinea]|uniref:Uu.00g047890.m01.CDS01 n=1 Tax=Anthostomella pinea TaxID=933095 RepID=A0AAI8VBN0_9PEZI|nr:Uu.00g047890.m01.CDS01 [Anthostomella pinea]
MPSGHVKATANGTVVAESDTYELVEGNVYFPPASVKTEYLTKTDLSTHCPWKGDASYYSIKVGDKELTNAAWYYPTAFEKAQHFEDYVAFYKTKVDVTTV